MQKPANCTECALKGASFRNTSLCDLDPCDQKTTDCKSTDGKFTCTCRQGYLKTDFSDRVCAACPSGQKANTSGICVDCSFGYSGLNCEESWQLILVIAGSVLGGLLLISIILLPIVALKCSKSSKSKDNSRPIQSPVSMVNGHGQSGHGPSYANSGAPKMPRGATNNWDSRGNLEMAPSNSRQNLIYADRNSRAYEDTDDMRPYSQVRPGGFGQARPQSNPYEMTRPQGNPYDQNRGQTNSYYGGRRYD